MSIITISRGSYSYGKEVAHKVAEKLGYECVDRDVLLEASEEFHIPEIMLTHAIEDAPSIWDRVTYKKEKYITFICAAILNHLKRDNVVYHGFAGHFFVQDIAHVLKVRINANMDERVKFVMQRDQVSSDKALQFIKKIDTARSKWSKFHYGIDTCDAKLYDLVIHIDRLSVDNVVEMVCQTASLPQFQQTAASQQTLEDLALASHVKAALIDLKTGIDVSANSGEIHVKTEASIRQAQILEEKITEAAGKIPGVTKTIVDITPFGTGQ